VRRCLLSFDLGECNLGVEARSSLGLEKSMSFTPEVAYMYNSHRKLTYLFTTTSARLSPKFDSRSPRPGVRLRVLLRTAYLMLISNPPKPLPSSHRLHDEPMMRGLAKSWAHSEYKTSS
jgi:hypothetical protein